MTGIRPVLDLLRAAAAPRLARLVRLKARHLDVLAPADMHIRLALKLADLERRA